MTKHFPPGTKQREKKTEWEESDFYSRKIVKLEIEIEKLDEHVNTKWGRKSKELFSLFSTWLQIVV